MRLPSALRPRAFWRRAEALAQAGRRAVVGGAGVPLGDHLQAASPSEVRLVEATLAAVRVGRTHRAGRPRQKPLRLIADRGYNSDALCEELAARGIGLMAPHR
jgi:hypothetical protein